MTDAADTVDLLVFVDAEPNAADDSAEDVQDVVDAVYFVVNLLLLDDVDDNIDVEVGGMMLDPDG